MERDDWDRLRKFSVALKRLSFSVGALTWEKTDPTVGTEFLLSDAIRDLNAVRDSVKPLEPVLHPPPGFDSKQWIITLLVELNELEPIIGLTTDIPLQDWLGTQLESRIQEASMAMANRATWISEYAWFERPEMTSDEEAEADKEIDQGETDRMLASREFLKWAPIFKKNHPNFKGAMYREFLEIHKGRFPRIMPDNLRGGVHYLRKSLGLDKS